MVKLIRDFNTLSRRKKLAVGIVSTIIGGVLLIAMDLSIGFTIDQAIHELAITSVVSLLACVVLGIIVRLKPTTKRYISPN